jgi:hypothetical protein
LLEIHCRITITKCEYRAIKLTDHTHLLPLMATGKTSALLIWPGGAIAPRPSTTYFLLTL